MKLLHVPEVITWLSSMGLDAEDAEKIFRLLDSDGDNAVSLEELAVGVGHLKGHARSVDLVTCINEQRDLSLDVSKLHEEVSMLVRRLMATEATQDYLQAQATETSI